MEPRTYFQRYLDDCFEKICATKLVKEATILNRFGVPVRSTFSEESISVQNSGLYESLLDKARVILHRLDPDDEVLIVRVKTINNEAVIATDPENQLVFITVQQPEP
ncbi:conserved hypothetical protein [Culex quinquefasciatus]|uniref:Roadblock/LAMTOR2 domain-containing protein n=1 Tax=Culex quinquefasciatus TaxID=7176 RepID=B0W2A8_CULQU|nr:conserved hypothetical protein [Culex quinquefasciatus]|eukprot:XP_001842880.1 conserved hypothetical protein [Culex quinquefasciatus]